MTPKLSVDHLVLVTCQVEATLAFYERVLGAQVRDVDEWRSGVVEYPVLHFGGFKFNVHPADTSAEPRAANPLPGTLDIALRWNGDVASAEAHIRSHGVEVLVGPIPQEGAAGEAESVYFRDLDGTLIELICYRPDDDKMKRPGGAAPAGHSAGEGFLGAVSAGSTEAR
ncbi:MAG: VOC family protein [Microbacteriaceae bacterium]